MQVAVFMHDVKSHAPLDPNGKPVPRNQAACYVFDSMADAEQFCAEKVAAIEHLHCEIYDHRGKIYPLREFTHARHAHRIPNRASAIRMIVIAWLLLAISPVLFFWDYKHDGTLVVPTVVAFACIVTAGRLLYWGHSELSHAKQNQAKS